MSLDAIIHKANTLAKQGKNDEDIVKELKRMGWPVFKINEAMTKLQEQRKKEAQRQPASLKHSDTDTGFSMKDADHDSGVHLHQAGSQHADAKHAGKMAPAPDSALSLEHPQDEVRKEKKPPLPFPRFLHLFVRILNGEHRFRAVIALLVFSLITAMHPSYIMLTRGLRIAESLQESVHAIVEDVYPAELQIAINDGTVSTNVTEPYHLTLSMRTLDDAFGISSDGISSYMNITVNDREVDTDKLVRQSSFRLLTLNTTGSVEEFSKFQSLGMLTAHSFVTYGENEGETVVTSIDENTNLTITRPFLTEQVNTFFREFEIEKWAVRAVYFSPVVFIISYLLGNVIIAFGFSILTYIMARILQMSIPYNRLFAATAFLYLLKQIINTLLDFTSLTGYMKISIGSVLSVLMITILYTTLRELHHKFPEFRDKVEKQTPVGVPTAQMQAMMSTPTATK